MDFILGFHTGDPKDAAAALGDCPEAACDAGAMVWLFPLRGENRSLDPTR